MVACDSNKPRERVWLLASIDLCAKIARLKVFVFGCAFWASIGKVRGNKFDGN